MSDLINQTISRWKSLRGEKDKWNLHYEDLARILLPQRLGFSSTTITGERRNDDIYDSTPMQAARGLANAIGGMMRPEGLPKVDMRVEDDELDGKDEVKDWLSDSEERLKDGFNNPKARFRQASGEKDLDLVVFGTAVMFTGESQLKNHLLFQSIHLRDATPFFSEEGQPEGIFLKRRLSLRQVAARFGEDNLSQRSREDLKKSPDKKIDLLHAIIPRNEFRNNALFAKDLPFADLWIELEAKKELSVNGFHEFPFIIPRWDTASGEDMGRSPGMIALPDGETLQAMGETILVAGQRAADPPLAAPNDGAFDVLNTFPGGITYYDVETAVSVRGNPFFEIGNGANLPISRDMQQDTRSQIFAAFFRNVLNLPIQGPQMTATEVIQRKEEFIREIGPVFGRLESDDTAPVVERAFNVMLRAGGFAPIPKILQGKNIRFEYDSPTRRIRQQVEASAAKMWAQEMIVLGQTKPEAIDLVNVDELGRFSAEALGIPEKIVNGKERVEDIRKARQQAILELEQKEQLRESVQIADTGLEVAKKAGLLAQ